MSNFESSVRFCQILKQVFLMEKKSRKEKKLKRSRKRNVWKTRTRLERGPRDVINSAKWLNLVRGNMVSMYEWKALPQRGEHYTTSYELTQYRTNVESTKCIVIIVITLAKIHSTLSSFLNTLQPDQPTDRKWTF